MTQNHLQIFSIKPNLIVNSKMIIPLNADMYKQKTSHQSHTLQIIKTNASVYKQKNEQPQIQKQNQKAILQARRLKGIHIQDANLLQVPRLSTIQSRSFMIRSHCLIKKGNINLSNPNEPNAKDRGSQVVSVSTKLKLKQYNFRGCSQIATKKNKQYDFAIFLPVNMLRSSKIQQYFEMFKKWTENRCKVFIIFDKQQNFAFKNTILLENCYQILINNITNKQVFIDLDFLGKKMPNKIIFLQNRFSYMETKFYFPFTLKENTKTTFLKVMDILSIISFNLSENESQLLLEVQSKRYFSIPRQYYPLRAIARVLVNQKMFRATSNNQQQIRKQSLSIISHRSSTFSEKQNQQQSNQFSQLSTNLMIFFESLKKQKQMSSPVCKNKSRLLVKQNRKSVTPSLTSKPIEQIINELSKNNANNYKQITQWQNQKANMPKNEPIQCVNVIYNIIE